MNFPGRMDPPRVRPGITPIIPTSIEENHHMKYRKLTVAAVAALGLALAGCGSDASDANVASENLSVASTC